MPSLEAVIHTCGSVKNAPWPLPPEPYPAYLRLHGGMTLAEVGLVVAEVARFGGEPLGDSAAGILKWLCEQQWRVVCGGILVRNGEREIDPGGFGGLEDWREWYGLRTGQGLPGYSTDAWTKRTLEGIRICNDVPSSPPGAAGAICIDFTWNELREALDQVQQDLHGFVRVLEAWAASLAPELAALFVEAMDRWFALTRARES